MKAFFLAAAFGLALAASAAAQPFKMPPPPSAESMGSVFTPPPEAKVTLQTTAGDIVIQLESKKAPRTVANFLRYAKAGYYDNIRIYRADPGFLIQMGDVLADGANRFPLYRPIRLETDNGLRHVRGSLALAHADSDPNSGDSTFYINLAANPSLDPKPGAKPNTTGYAVFGRVIAGMAVADKIAAAPRRPKSAGGSFPGQEPVKPVVVKKTIVVEQK
ncbi:MAG: peptidylprolyl isomerase [Hyphomonadaceae bacterium]